MKIDPLETEIGRRAYDYLEIENSHWAYHLWFMSGRFWWDDIDHSWVTETRPEILAFCKGLW